MARGVLDRLVVAKLEMFATEILNEGWKWAQAHIDFPHSHGMRRVYPHPVPLSEEDQQRMDAMQAEKTNPDSCERIRSSVGIIIIPP